MEQQLTLDYYNTNHEVREVLNNSISKNQIQQNLILKFFQVHSSNFTPCEIETYFPNFPLTSIRRAVTNLTREGKLIKTHKMKIGKYGKQCHTWRLA